MLFPVVLAGCFFGGDGSASQIPVVKNSEDLEAFSPSAGDDTEFLEGETYYTSKSIDLVTEVNGNYTIDKPFTLDKNNENKRIYHNIYFYVDDYFQIIYYKNINQLGTVFAILADESDKQYVDVKTSGNGTPYQISIKEQGIYDLVFDITTFAIDMVKVDDITTPVYETIRSCELCVHVSANNTTYTKMEYNSETKEFYVQKTIPINASIGFFSSSHNGHYKMTINDLVKDKLVYGDNVTRTQAIIHVGGTYNVYFNAKTYVLRLELVNPDTAQYYCSYDGEVLSSANETPYLFEKIVEVSSQDVYGQYYAVPKPVSMFGSEYALSKSDGNDTTIEFWTSSGRVYIKKAGTFVVSINLKTFVLTITEYGG